MIKRKKVNLKMLPNLHTQFTALCALHNTKLQWKIIELIEVWVKEEIAKQ